MVSLLNLPATILSADAKNALPSSIAPIIADNDRRHPSKRRESGHAALQHAVALDTVRDLDGNALRLRTAAVGPRLHARGAADPGEVLLQVPWSRREDAQG